MNWFIPHAQNFQMLTCFFRNAFNNLKAGGRVVGVSQKVENMADLLSFEKSTSRRLEFPDTKGELKDFDRVWNTLILDEVTNESLTFKDYFVSTQLIEKAAS